MAGLIPPAYIALGQIELYPDWPKRLLVFPVLLLISTGMMLSNSRAVLEALTGRGGNEFKRTPKFHVVRRGDRLAGSRYVVRPDWTTPGELLLGLYAAAGLGIAAVKFPAMAPYMAVYVLAFGTLALWSLWQTRQATH
jgi:hypothetical protein